MKRKAMFLLYAGAMVLGLGTSAWRLAYPSGASASLGVICGNTSCFDGTPGGNAKLYCPKGCTTCGGVYCGS